MPRTSRAARPAPPAPPRRWRAPPPRTYTAVVTRPSTRFCRPTAVAAAADGGRPTPSSAATSPAATRSPPTKLLWVEPTSIAAVGAALEAGVGVLVFDERDPDAPPTVPRGAAARVGRFDALALRPGGAIVDVDGARCGVVVTVRGPADVDAAAARAAGAAADARAGVVVDPADWAVIPAENLVAAWQGARRAGAHPPPLIMRADTADAALTAACALETGVDGVLLTTGDPAAVKAVAAALAGSGAPGGGERVHLAVATVTAVTPAGVGDRVCADLTTLLAPGEGLCVGSFAGGALLVASERDDGAYVPPRPFRVNAGAVHSYVDVPGGRTAYLAELAAGAAVLVVAPDGTSRPATVGRAKIEARPMLRVDVVADDDGGAFSAVLQNAETVKLVAPVATGAIDAVATDGGATDSPTLSAADGGASDVSEAPLSPSDAATLAWVQRGGGGGGDAGPPSLLSRSDADAVAWALGPGPGAYAAGVPPTDASSASPSPRPASPGERAALAWLVRPEVGWRTVSVADLRPGDRVFVRRSAAVGRHTGLQVDERVLEK